MTLTKVIGGNRVGSGKKMKVELHGYDRSTHDLSKVFRSTMACGTLVPCYVNIGLNGDTWDIDTQAIIRTLPTNAPLFGSFKMQVDWFVVPLRLYNGTLHNNPINVGLKMQNIPFQKLTIYHNTKTDKNRNFRTCQINGSALLRYLGLKGVGSSTGSNGTSYKTINATSILAYYDIFKNYYANKQEENFYWIGNKNNQADTTINYITGWYSQQSGAGHTWKATGNEVEFNGNTIWIYEINGNALNTENISFTINETTKTLNEFIEDEEIFIYQISDTKIAFKFTEEQLFTPSNTVLLSAAGTGEENRIELKECPLEALDRVRELTLGMTEAIKKEATNSSFNEVVTYFGQGYYNEEMLEQLPDFSNINGYQDEKPNNSIYSQYGLCIKTYQNDMFNNWLDKEIIDGDNGIAAVTTIDTSDGLNLDALNLAQKVYNMLNRIAISGGTYQDWQEVQYGERVIKLAETPIYEGGCSYEIGFEEVVSTTDTEDTNNTALGSLAGKGTIINREENKVVIHIEEPSIIMAIASITPRIDYSDGNKWYLTELLNYGDLHVPALDTIGYQNLKAEQMAWWTYTSNIDDEMIWESPAVGKLPAWINYMTDVNETYGDFVDTLDFMVLNRNYERILGNNIKDITSYIDPTKYNLAFSNADLYAQNFWVQLGFNIETRRKMSAKIIPNL